MHAAETHQDFRHYEVLEWLTDVAVVSRAARISVFLLPARTSYLPALPTIVRALHLASSVGLLDLVKALLLRDMTPDVVDSNEWTALRWAAWQNHLDVMRLLVFYGADIDFTDKSGDTTLIWALKESKSVPETLVTHNVSSGRGVTMHIGTTYQLCSSRVHMTWLGSSSVRCSDEVLRFLISCTKHIDAADKYGRTPLIHAAGRRQFQHVQTILSRGANVSLKDHSGMNAMLCALRPTNKNVELPKIIIDGIASAHIGNHIIIGSSEETDQADAVNFGMTPADIEHTITQLISRTDTAARDRSGRSVLALAITSGQLGLAQELLDCGADVLALDDEGMTPISRASRPPHFGST